MRRLFDTESHATEHTLEVRRVLLCKEPEQKSVEKLDISLRLIVELALTGKLRKGDDEEDLQCYQIRAAAVNHAC